MIKSYIFITEMKSTEGTFSKEDFVNNHKINTKISCMLYQKVTNNKQYKRLYRIDNKLSSPHLSTRKIIIHYFKTEIE